MSTSLPTTSLDEFETRAEPVHPYRALSRLAVGSVAVGVLSILSALEWYLGLVPVIGILLGWMALRRIQGIPEELTGRRVAQAGICLSLAMWVFGITCLSFARIRDVPFGYKPLTFEQMQPDRKVRGETIPPAVLKLEGEKVFVTGFMYPGRQVTGIQRFIMVPSIGHCSFCTRQLRSTEMIRVSLTGDLTADFTSHEVRLGGTLRIDKDAASDPYGGFPYLLEGDYLR
jgi:hypothetical protein